jgi:hypothetical protein
MFTNNVYKNVISLLEKDKIHIIPKDKSLFMRILSKLIFFNKKFMTKFITTIGETIYLSTGFNDLPETSRVITLLHEYVHINQKRKDKLFSLKYLFPQSLIILSFAAFLCPPMALFMLFLLPIPAYFRMKYEAEAYGLSLFLFKKSGIYHMDFEFEHCIKQFTGPNYYFMWPFEDFIRKEILYSWHRIEDGNPTENQKKSLDLLSSAIALRT